MAEATDMLMGFRGTISIEHMWDVIIKQHEEEFLGEFDKLPDDK